jgi:hypothetical protein
MLLRRLVSVILSHPFLNTAILMLGSLSVGLIVAYPSLSSHDLNLYFTLTSSQSTIFTSPSWLTALVGIFFSQAFLSKYDQLFLVQMSALCGVVSWLILLNANPEQQFFVLLHRALAGVALGSLHLLLPWYMTEIAPLEVRSLYGSMHQLGVHLGIFLTNLIGIFCDWWELSVCGLVIFSLFLISSGFLPQPQKYQHSTVVL